MNPVTPPGITILENIRALSMNQQELAERMGRPLKTVNEIIKGKTALTPETALQLERVIGIPADFWLAREARYREYLERKREERLLHEAPAWLGLFPLKEMIARRWIQKQEGVLEQTRELLNFFGIAKPVLWTQILNPYSAFRRSAACKEDEGALAAWLRKGEVEARNIPCQPYHERNFKDILRKIREMTKEVPEEFGPTVQTLCANAGVAVVFIRELRGTGASGVTRWLAPDKAILQVSARYKTDDQFWFTFFHEAGHIIHNGKRESFMECEDNVGESEELANSFSADLLINSKEYRSLLEEGKKKSWHLNRGLIEEFARSAGIAPGIVVGRLQHDGVIPYRLHNKLKKTLTWPDLLMK